MLMPDVVIAVALEFERLGLSVMPRGRRALDPETLWRIPADINVVPLPPPPRKIRKQDTLVLQNRRAGNRGGVKVTNYTLDLASRNHGGLEEVAAVNIDLTNPIFRDEVKATAHMEANRWPYGVYCPLCGSTNVHRMGGKTQAGMFLCNDCRDKFTVRTGTIFQRSHIPLHKWLLATHFISERKKSVSALQLQRILGLGSYRSALFMCNRIREAMNPAKVGGTGSTARHRARGTKVNVRGPTRRILRRSVTRRRLARAKSSA
jgi:transposase-like protein